MPNLMKIAGAHIQMVSNICTIFFLDKFILQFPSSSLDKKNVCRQTDIQTDGPSDSSISSLNFVFWVVI